MYSMPLTLRPAIFEGQCWTDLDMSSIQRERSTTCPAIRVLVLNKDDHHRRKSSSIIRLYTNDWKSILTQQLQ
jgi:hypothetical protein